MKLSETRAEEGARILDSADTLFGYWDDDEAVSQILVRLMHHAAQKGGDFEADLTLAREQFRKEQSS